MHSHWWWVIYVPFKEGNKFLNLSLYPRNITLAQGARISCSGCSEGMNKYLQRFSKDYYIIIKVEICDLGTF